MNRLLMAAALTSAALLAGCSADKTDFSEAAQKVISDEWKKQFDEDLDDVACDEPASTEVGTTFPCSATGPDGTGYTFTATISKKDEVSVAQD